MSSERTGKHPLSAEEARKCTVGWKIYAEGTEPPAESLGKRRKLKAEAKDVLNRLKSEFRSGVKFDVIAVISRLLVEVIDPRDYEVGITLFGRCGEGCVGKSGLARQVLPEAQLDDQAPGKGAVADDKHFAGPKRVRVTLHFTIG